MKENQPILCAAVSQACASTAPLSQTQTIDKNKRNRHETRNIAVFDTKSVPIDDEWKPHIAAIIRVERIVYAFKPTTGLWPSSTEVSFYLSNQPIEAIKAGTSVRSHWQIENGLHYVRDVTMREDASRIRKKPGIFATIRSFGYNILRCNQKSTMAQDRYAAALGGFDNLAEIQLC